MVLFQETYNLTSDGTLNNETLALLLRPRCGLADDPFKISEYTAYPTKWNRTNLTWHFFRGSPAAKTVAIAAFQLWELDSNLKFTHKYYNADIVISFGGIQHSHTSCNKKPCSYNFDGAGYVLAHAFTPRMDGGCVEIHLDSQEDWDFGFNIPPPNGKTSLFSTLVHEIGHTLGLGHSSNPNAIMYAYYNPTSPVQLNTDDINGIQFLYGLKNKYTTMQTTTKQQ